jgi:hypothetical protein
MTTTTKSSKKTKRPEAPVTIIPLGSTTMEIREKARAGKAPNPTIIKIAWTGGVFDDEDDYFYYEKKVKKAYEALEREGVQQIVFTFPEKR